MLNFKNLINLSKYQLSTKVVLGIETSCDDTAVAIVDSNKNILASRNISKKDSQFILGGICPSVTSELHRNNISKAIEGCMGDSRLRFGDLDAIAVTSRPGIVLCLKVGANKAVDLARKYNLPLIPVHHMRAHSLSGGLDKNVTLKYPFVTLLISGGHSLIAIAHSPVNFELIGQSEGGSPGECLDKIGRAVGISSMVEYKNYHTGAIIEKLATEAKNEENFIKYSIKNPSTKHGNFNFYHIKASYLTLLNKININEIDLISFCASVQFTVASHICSKVHLILESLRKRNNEAHQLVVSGGVASNQFIRGCLAKVCKHHNFDMIIPPKELCTDNGEMIAWTGCEIMKYYEEMNNKDNDDIIYDVKDYLYVMDKEDIGKDSSKYWGPQKADKRIVQTSLLPFEDKLITKLVKKS